MGIFSNFLKAPTSALNIGQSLGIGLGGMAISGLFAKRQAEKQMDFQRVMSSTAHQREVEDLRKAGLNPILSGTGGAGASTPSGAMATVDPVNSGLSLMKSVQDIKLMEQQIKKLELENRGSNRAYSDWWNAINPFAMHERYQQTHPNSAKGLNRVQRANQVPSLKELFKDTQKFKDFVDTDINP